MSNPAAETLAWLRGRLDHTAEAVQRLGNQIGLWLVVGNAGALGLAYQTMIKDGGNPVVLKQAAFWFASGLASAFAGLSLSYVLGLLVIRHISVAVNGLTVVVQNFHHIDEIDRQYPDHTVPPDAPLYIEAEAADAKIQESAAALSRLMPWSVAIIVILVTSAIAFGLGATVPMRSALPLATPVTVANKITLPQPTAPTVPSPVSSPRRAAPSPE